MQDQKLRAIYSVDRIPGETQTRSWKDTAKTQVQLRVEKHPVPADVAANPPDC